PKLALLKTGKVNDQDGNGAIEAADTITYSFEVSNTGNVIVNEVTPSDEGPTFNGKPAGGKLGAFTPAPVTLSPGKTQVFTAIYKLTQEDI
ncbi:hypothetical protein, partial [Paraburkholderia sp. SIMBA_054]|uniref:DUF7507 domain-containing protein n=1 Tax=Paraburkholderia sp. SIMBA_054 TaxID=3085795 RepID=UPI00397E7003